MHPFVVHCGNIGAVPNGFHAEPDGMTRGKLLKSRALCVSKGCRNFFIAETLVTPIERVILALKGERT